MGIPADGYFQEQDHFTLQTNGFYEESKSQERNCNQNRASLYDEADGDDCPISIRRIRETHSVSTNDSRLQFDDAQRRKRNDKPSVVVGPTNRLLVSLNASANPRPIAYAKGQTALA